MRAGRVMVGVEAVRRGLQSGECRCVVVADDASPRALEKVVRLARGKKIRQVRGPHALEMGARLGKPPVMVVGVEDAGLADAIWRAGTVEQAVTEE